MTFVSKQAYDEPGLDRRDIRQGLNRRQATPDAAGAEEKVGTVVRINELRLRETAGIVVRCSEFSCKAEGGKTHGQWTADKHSIGGDIGMNTDARQVVGLIDRTCKTVGN